MKRTLIVLLLPFILFGACRKKSTADGRNWYCVKKDSIVSNIPALNNPNAKDSIVTYHSVSEGNIKFMILQYTRKDTAFSRNDTLEIEYWTMWCNQIDN